MNVHTWVSYLFFVCVSVDQNFPRVSIPINLCVDNSFLAAACLFTDTSVIPVVSLFSPLHKVPRWASFG